MKKWLIILTGVLAVTGVVVFRIINRGPVNVAKARATEITSEKLYSAFSNDPAGSSLLYSGKILRVSGLVSKVVNPDNKQPMLVLLATSISGAYVNCSIEGNATPPVLGLQVSIKGICSGIGEGDADLGISADVYLSRCIITDKQK